MVGEDELKIDFGDGVSALDRTMRAIVLITNGAIANIEELGWRRDEINLEIGADPLPCWVLLRRKRVFEIFGEIIDGSVLIKSRWLTKVSKPGLLDRIWRG